MMRTIITLDSKKISKKAACEMYGEADVNKMIREAKEAFLEDPNEESTWWMRNGMLTVEFRQNRGRTGANQRPLFQKNA